MPACGPAEASPWAGDVSEGTLVSSSGPCTPAGVRIRRSSRRDPGEAAGVALPAPRRAG
jgi:hypothetical protein